VALLATGFNSKPSKSHDSARSKMLNADRPKDWTTRVDYRNGMVHIRAEVLEKPDGGAPTTWTSPSETLFGNSRATFGARLSDSTTIKT
jgi:hypothetical protein